MRRVATIILGATAVLAVMSGTATSALADGGQAVPNGGWCCKA